MLSHKGASSPSLTSPVRLGLLFDSPRLEAPSAGRKDDFGSGMGMPQTRMGNGLVRQTRALLYWAIDAH